MENTEYKRYDFLRSLNIEILSTYLIEDVYSVLVKQEDIVKLEKLCLIQKIDNQNNLYKCIFKKDW